MLANRKNNTNKLTKRQRNSNTFASAAQATFVGVKLDKKPSNRKFMAFFNIASAIFTIKSH